MYIIKNYYYISIYQHGKISSVTLYQKVDFLYISAADLFKTV